MAKLITVIEATEFRGNGTEGDPNRTVRVFYQPDGTEIVEYDPWLVDDLRSRLNRAFAALVALRTDLENEEDDAEPNCEERLRAIEDVLIGRR